MKNKKTRITAFFLCLFFGLLGIHRFYLRKNKTAFLMLISLGGLGIWYIVDLFLIATGRLERKEKGILSSLKKIISKK